MRYATPVIEFALGTGFAIGAYNAVTGTTTGIGFLVAALLFLIALGVAAHGVFLGVETAVRAARSPGSVAEADHATTADRPRPSDGATAE